MNQKPLRRRINTLCSSEGLEEHRKAYRSKRQADEMGGLEEDPKFLLLPKGRKCIVDAEDYDYLNRWRWGCCNGGYKEKKYYVLIRVGYNARKFIHRVIMSTPKGKFVDHIDGNSLNNKKSNLRNCSHKENMRNRKKNKNSNSIYKGVHLNGHKTWTVQISGNYCGSFKTEIEAAMTYDKIARIQHGEFAKLNFPTL